MMTLPLFVALTLAGAVPAPARVTETTIDARQELMALERTWGEAIIKHDTMAIDRILAEEYILITPSGQAVTRGQELENTRSSGASSFELKEVSHTEMKVRICGDAAVITSRFTIKGEAEGREVQSPFRQADVFVKRAGRWKCVSRQATRIVEPAELAVETD